MPSAETPIDPIRAVTELLARLPGVGERTAQRLTFHLLRQDAAYTAALAAALTQLTRDVALCARCHDFTAGGTCAICRDARRDQALVCVVATPQDLHAVEATGEYRGLYHVLGGLLSPLEGVGPDNLRVRELVVRLGESAPREVILALRPSVEGESTSFYLQKLLKPLGVAVTVIASGVPMGGEIEYADRMTLARALTGRRPA
ncbi:MAG: recombination protein RecR [Deltaproteobacteria bacterium]|nr:recombination protein RecR [Deltaproteobacteria bacterium]